PYPWPRSWCSSSPRSLPAWWPRSSPPAGPRTSTCSLRCSTSSLSRLDRARERPTTTPAVAYTIVRPMHETSPKVFLIARPSLDLDGISGYLEDVGGESWLQGRLGEAEAEAERAGAGAGSGRGGAVGSDEASGVNPGELLVEFGGRACYRSWEPGLNPNVTK